MTYVAFVLILLRGVTCFAEVNVVLMGGPGSGKGTLGHRLASHFGIVHVSAGDLLREQVRLGTPLGEKAKGLMAKGDLFPDTREGIAPLLGLIEQTLRAHPGGFVLEGFSRSEMRAREFERLLQSLGRELSAAVMLDVSHGAIVRRLVHRTVCPTCQRSFNVGEFAPCTPGVCDDCSVPLVKRNDDRPEVIAHRLEVYESNLEPVLRLYEKMGQLVRLDGERLDARAFGALVRRLGDREPRGLNAKSGPGPK